MNTSKATPQNIQGSKMASGKLFDASAMKATTTSIWKLLHEIPISNIIDHRNMIRNKQQPYKLIDVHEDTRIGDVLNLLSDKNILAVPVYKLNEQKIKFYQGIVSVYDILAWTVFQRVFDQMDDLKSRPESKDLSLKEKEILKAQGVFFGKKIGELIGYTYESSQAWSVRSGDKLSGLVSLMTEGKYHRVLVVDDREMGSEKSGSGMGNMGTVGAGVGGATSIKMGSERVSMLTQTDLIMFLTEKLKEVRPELIQQVFSMPLEKVNELSLLRNESDPNQPSFNSGATTRSKSAGMMQHQQSSPLHKRVIKVSDKVSALSAFRTLYNHRVSAVCVVDEKGCIEANLSASDLRGIKEENLENLLLPVYNYLETGERRSKHQPKADQLRTLNFSNTVKESIELMKSSNIHRIWLVDNNDMPQGVITMTDILNLFVPEQKKGTEE